MLWDAQLPKLFWAEAVNTICYLINKSPSSAINFKSPNEMWYGEMPDYTRLRVFGYQAFAHMKQNKLEPKVHYLWDILQELRGIDCGAWSLETKDAS